MSRNARYITILITAAILMLVAWVGYTLLVTTDQPDGSTTTRTSPTTLE